MRPKKVKQIRIRCSHLVCLSVALIVSFSSWNVSAGDFPDSRFKTGNVVAKLDNVEMAKRYALGISRFDLDAHTELLGWRISNDWYFGRQDGLDSGLTFVWQQAENQVSLSKDGVRLTRRF